MNAILLLVIGIVLGIVVGWLGVTARSKAELAKAQIEAEGRIKTAESILSEVRAQLNALQTSLDTKEKEISGLQQLLRGEGEQKVKAQTELEQLKGTLEDLDALRERMKTEGELRVAAETKLQEAQASLEEQKRLLEDAKKNLSDTFQALSAEALKSNNQAFITLARSTFETIPVMKSRYLRWRKPGKALTARSKSNCATWQLQTSNCRKRPRLWRSH
jgi:DNA recombination protein RmuC